MTRYTQLKLAFAFIGLAIWLWGQRVDDPNLRWLGIGFLAASVLMRFLPKRLRREDYRDPTESSSKES